LGHEVYVLTHHKTTDIDDPYTIDLRLYFPQSTLWDRLLFRLSPATARFKTLSSTIADAISALVKNHKIDVLEMEESFGWSFAISRLKLLPVVVRLHGPWFVTGKFGDPEYGNALNRYRQEWERRGIQHAQLVTSPSEEVLGAVKNRYSLKLIGSRVIPNPIKAAVENETWDVTTCSKDSLLFVGRFDKRKGGDLVLRAFARLAEQYPHLKLTFVGPDRGINEGENTFFFEEFVVTNIPEALRSRLEFLGAVDGSSISSLRPKYFARRVFRIPLSTKRRSSCRSASIQRHSNLAFTPSPVVCRAPRSGLSHCAWSTNARGR
jgi:glycosyltransferase involved in cell wall biosynthesis